ncbi:MAG: NAD+ synthase [Candidatus Lokiarchaeota archaeon]|jgi:NAD+ synthase (glutamine-hydrolysing)
MKKSNSFQICLAQVNPVVGDIEYNMTKVLNIIKEHQEVDLIVFPEMFLTGYPLMDHIHDPLIKKQNREAIDEIRKSSSETAIILGTFTESDKIEDKLHPFYNSALLIQEKEIKAIINKRILPDYDVFYERRYFSFDNNFLPVKIKDKNLGILICEDIWDENYETKVADKLKVNGAEFLIVINASPYHIHKFELRKGLICKKARELSVPIIYLNMVGGLDEIVYDGQSFAVNKFGQIIFKGKAFEEELNIIDLIKMTQEKVKPIKWEIDWRKEVLNALKLNLYDYYHKSGVFQGVVLGLSGGIDSAFTAYICTKALGSENVTAIMMPTRFTSQESIDYAKELCQNLKIKYIIHPIDELFEIYQTSIKENLGSLQFDIADENLQARIRATLLMYYSNKFNWLLISTGNKSEIGVGYCTLYGDTNGGKNVPGDLFKIQIYKICEYINRKNEIIPYKIIQRTPTAELRENQKDTDSLPPYEILDKILEAITKNGIGSDVTHLVKQGIEINTIRKVEKLYLSSEYKRRQLVQTIKVSESAFGIGRKYPVLKRIDLSSLNSSK